MNLSAIFIKRPIATTLLAIGLAIGGVVAFMLLPVAPLPQIDFPTIMVQAGLPGASAEIMATSVATPLETFLGRIAGTTEMTSSSSLGSTRIAMQFDLNRDIDGAARDVQAALNSALSRLPTNLPNNPIYRKINPADAPILIIALTSDHYSTGQIYDAASTILQQKLSQVTGVGQVFVGGSSLPAVRVELNPPQLSSYGISLNEVATTLANANVNLAKGNFNNSTLISSIKTNDQIFKAKDYAPLIITYKNNSPVRIKDVADVIDSVEDIRNAGLANGKPAVMLVIFKQPGANVITTIQTVRAMLPQLNASIPRGIDMKVVMDRTSTIQASLHDIEITLIIAMILVILVAYLFLGSFRTMLVPAVAVPLSLLGTCIIMRMLGYSLDNLSLLALTIANGFVVDDAVVVLENISRHIEMGKNSFQAALDGTKEVGFTVLSMSLSLIVVFIPILLMGGIVGRLFREFSMTLGLAILVSLVISLTVTPVMCSRLLKNREQSPSLFEKLNFKNKYAESLAWSIERPTLMVMIVLATIAITGCLFYIVPKGFFPQQDTGRITGSLQAEQDISFQSLRDKLERYVAIIGKDPGVANVVGFIGGGGINSGSVFITLKDINQRKVSVDIIINRLRGKLASVIGSDLYLQAAQDLLIGARQGNAQFQFSLSADNLEDLNLWTPRVMAEVKKIASIADVNSNVRDHGLQMFVQMDRNTLLRLGLDASIVDNALYSAFGQRQVSTMYTAMNQYHVVMEAAPQYWQSPESLNDLYVIGTNGQNIPLSSFASFAPTSTLLSVNHQGQTPSATLSFNLLPNVALGDAVNQVSQVVENMHLPPTIRTSFQGTAQAFQASLANEPLLITAALLTVYIVLGILYESLIHPITILSTLPSAGVGALLALLLTRTDLSIIALIGLILLIGIVKKNAILMIDFALELQRHQNKTPKEAIYEAAILRFRPIMMTTMAALFGAIPLVIGFGLGSELRRPLGIAIIGGLIFSQLLTLYTTPAIYLKLDSLAEKWRKRWSIA